MSETVMTHIIARIRTDFPTKFGIPRQSGLADVPARIVFEPEYRNADALRGIEEYSHLWLIWQFSEAVRESWSPTVRPPKLGGNRRVGVFATRSPFRPNAIGLSSVRLHRVEYGTPEGRHGKQAGLQHVADIGYPQLAFQSLGVHLAAVSRHQPAARNVQPMREHGKIERRCQHGEHCRAKPGGQPIAALALHLPTDAEIGRAHV